MTKTKAAGTLLLFLWLAVSPEDGLPQGKKSELHVYLMDCVGLSGDLLDAIRDEVDAIYRPAHIRIVWLEQRPPNPTQPYEARVYILAELPPSIRRLLTISKARAPMALILPIRPTELSADIYVSRNAVLGRASRRHPLPTKLMSRALGRAVAHELAHRFLRSRHTRQGILRPVFSERDLIDKDRSDLFFTLAQIAVLEAAAL
jgi:hypothetical protein